MNSLKNFFADHGREMLLLLAGFILLFMLLWFRLGSLTYGYAANSEVASQQAAFSWHTILHNPLNAPYTVMQRLVLLSGHHGVTSMRLITTAWAVLAMILFYIVARQWHSMRVASLATWLFITSAWFLHTARLATPEVLWLVAVLALVVLFTPNKDGRHNRLALPSILWGLSLLLYVPGVIWLVFFSIIIRRKNIAEAWEASSGWLVRSISILGSLVLLAPLGYALEKTSPLVRVWLGITPELQAPLIMGKHLLSVPKQLLYQGPLDPTHWLGRLPLLSVFEIVMFVVGVYFYVTHLRAARAKFIISLSLLSWLIIGIGGVASLSLIVPVVYLLIATGIAYLLHDWFRVFPRNPLARWIGIGVIAVAILLTSVYQTRSYFVAWRYSPDTRQAFNAKL